MIKEIINVFILQNRATFVILLAIICFGIGNYINIAKEMNPDVEIPQIMVSATLTGISTEDSNDLLVSPMIEVLRSVEGIEDIEGVATYGRAHAIMKFYSSVDIKKALYEVRQKIEDIKAKLPAAADNIVVKEFNASLFPIVNLVLSGDMPSSSLSSIAKELEKRLLSLPNVLSATLTGYRENNVAIIISPEKINNYEMNLMDIIDRVSVNNTFLPLGLLPNNMSIKINNSIKTIEEFKNIPVIKKDKVILRLGDIVDDIVPNTERASKFTRINGKEAVVLEISKRTGKNIIDTIVQVKTLISKGRELGLLPATLNVNFTLDQSKKIENMLSDLENNILFSMILVFSIIVIFIGLRNGLMTVSAIPISFLMGIIFVYSMGYTLNMVVLFSFILSLGMVVDTSVVIVEYADRQMINGMNRFDAFKKAALDMSLPIISSTLTTVAVFLPLIAWPGVIGGFIKYLPITVTSVLLSSMICALIFNPIIGILFGKVSTTNKKEIEKIIAIENAEIDKLSKPLKIYHDLLNLVLDHKGKFINLIIGSLFFTVMLYSKYNHGMIFFPAIEPDILMVKISNKEAQSLQEKNQLASNIEKILLKMNNNKKEFKSIYTKVTGNNINGIIGIFTLDLVDWRKRRKAAIIQKEIIENTKNIKGILIKVLQEKKGPGGGSPIDLRMTTYSDYNTLIETAEKIQSLIEGDGHFKNFDTDLGIPAMEWVIKVNKMRATELNVSMRTIQQYISLATDRLVIGKFKPINSSDDIDITVQFPENYQNISAIKNIAIETPNGSVPLSSIATITAQKKNNEIIQINSQLSISVTADMEGDTKVSEGLKIIKDIIRENDFPSEINIEFKGEAADQEETQAFLAKAFIVSLLLVFLVIAFQFNSYYYTFIIMSAILLSTTGVLLGLLITGKPFTMVMCGIGIISLAGIVVNNNILLIEVYTIFIKTMDRRQAIIRACISRIRPILITSGTTIVGLMPMAIGINVDLINREVTYGAPSGEMWTALATTISSGLIFATILTLFFTPVVLLYEKKKKN